MAHWAEIDKNNIVKRVLVTSNEEPDEGESWLADNLGGTWIQCSYNTLFGQHLLGGTPLRKNFPAEGFIYHPEFDCFSPPKKSWQSDFVLDAETGAWFPPVPFPEDADWVMGYQPQPESIEKEIQDADGVVIKILAPNLPDNAKVYSWIIEANDWGMMPNLDYPRPEGEHYWDPINKEWQAPEGERPLGDWYWDVFSKAWVEAPPPPELKEFPEMPNLELPPTE
jgi:hypothetical protein